MISNYMIEIYAFLIANGARTIESIPSIYQAPVAEFMAKREESKLD